jgi:hypothetical protein
MDLCDVECPVSISIVQAFMLTLMVVFSPENVYCLIRVTADNSKYDPTCFYKTVFII